MASRTSSPARDLSIDNLRTLAVLLLLPFHILLLYSFLPYHLHEQQISPTAHRVALVIHMWHMPILFLLAGCSAAAGLAKRGVRLLHSRAAEAPGHSPAVRDPRAGAADRLLRARFRRCRQPLEPDQLRGQLLRVLPGVLPLLLSASEPELPPPLVPPIPARLFALPLAGLAVAVGSRWRTAGRAARAAAGGGLAAAAGRPDLDGEPNPAEPDLQLLLQDG